MILIVGLGNPGAKYKNTRHNIGFQAIDGLLRKNNSPDFKLSQKFNAEISEGILNKEKVILAKPQTYMNLSGKSVKFLTKAYAPSSNNLIIVHDDIDLPLGKIRIVRNRGAAGHKGIESIVKELKAKNFARFRIGIAPQKGKPKNVEKFVLQKFNKDEALIVKMAIEKTIEAIEMTLKENLEKAMSKYNK